MSCEVQATIFCDGCGETIAKDTATGPEQEDAVKKLRVPDVLNAQHTKHLDHEPWSLTKHYCRQCRMSNDPDEVPE